VRICDLEEVRHNELTTSRNLCWVSWAYQPIEKEQTWIHGRAPSPPKGHAKSRCKASTRPRKAYPSSTRRKQKRSIMSLSSCERPEALGFAQNQESGENLNATARGSIVRRMQTSDIFAQSERGKQKQQARLPKHAEVRRGRLLGQPGHACNAREEASG